MQAEASVFQCRLWVDLSVSWRQWIFFGWSLDAMRMLSGCEIGGTMQKRIIIDGHISYLAISVKVIWVAYYYIMAWIVSFLTDHKYFVTDLEFICSKIDHVRHGIFTMLVSLGFWTFTQLIFLGSANVS